MAKTPWFTRFVRSLWFLGRVRVKYLVLVVIGVTPLVLLTIARLQMLATAADLPAIEVAELLQRVEAAEEDARRLRQQSGPLMGELTEVATQPFDGDSYRRILRAAGEEAPAEVNVRLIAAVTRLDRCRDLVEKCLETLAGSPEALRKKLLDSASPVTIESRQECQRALVQARERAVKLAQQIKQAVEDGFTGLDGLQQLLAARSEELDEYLALNQAELAFAAKRYDECLTLLSQPSWRSAAAGEAEQLQVRARFCNQAAELIQRLQQLLTEPPSDSWETEIAVIDKFSQDYPTPPHPDDKPLHDQVDTETQRVKGRYEFWRAGKRPTLPEQTRGLRTVVERFPKAKLGPEAKATLMQWMREGIREKTVYNPDPALQEAEGGNVLYIGVFELATGYYKFWRTTEERNKNPAGYRTVRPQDLSRRPGPLTPVVCVKAYANYREALLRDMESPAAWQQFLKECQGRQAELDEYVKKGGDAMSLTFQDVTDFARDIDRVWAEHVQALLDMGP